VNRFIEFTPGDFDKLVVTGIGNLTPEQIAAITAPFVPGEPIQPLAQLQTFTVTVDVSQTTVGVPTTYIDQQGNVRHDGPPIPFLVRVYLWVIGGSRLAPLSYNPFPFKTRLYRLTPNLFMTEVRDSTQVGINLSAVMGIARIRVEVRGLNDPTRNIR
jgi:hypothetical protein